MAPFVRDADSELLIVERATKEPEFDIWSARYDQRGLEEALTARRLAIGHFGGTAYLFNENGETFNLTSLDVKVDTTTFFERLDEAPHELLDFVGTEVADVVRKKETSPGR